MSDPRRTVAVTGSASGMGAAVTRLLDKRGAKVIGVDLSDADVTCDLGTEVGRKAAVEAVVEAADGRLDGLVACAGLGPQVSSGAAIVRVNYFGAVASLDGMLPLLERGESPSAVVIASNAASLTPHHEGLLEELFKNDEESASALAENLDGITSYGMSKLALVRAMRRRARSWGDRGVRLNAVAPGPIQTPMLEGILADQRLGPVVKALPVPLQRNGTPEEVASAIAFLLDPSNSFVHGSVLFVDGGSDAEMRPDAI